MTLTVQSVRSVGFGVLIEQILCGANFMLINMAAHKAVAVAVQTKAVAVWAVAVAVRIATATDADAV